ncbi:hypothetical protein PV342_39370 [Streptomyces sp. PA03-3a]|nr:hypothetical protein [Streptomyces sp. PA03-3a]
MPSEVGWRRLCRARFSSTGGRGREWDAQRSVAALQAEQAERERREQEEAAAAAEAARRAGGWLARFRS